jgi:dipeptidyl aminopeptidase/acylaminoacyl peptidase
MRLLFLLFILGGQVLMAQNEKVPFQREDVFKLEYASSPQVSNDGQKVVYVRNRMDIMKDRKTGNLWIVDIDSKNHKKLSNREARESSPSWSPVQNDDRIAFVSSTDEGSEIYVQCTKTGQSARLTQLEKSPRNLSWSPDGQHIAFTMMVPSKKESLVSPPKKPKGAKWADAPRITTSLKHEADGSGKLTPGFTHIFVIPAEGGSPRQISEGDFNFSGSLNWSKDGKQLIFSSNLHPDWEYKRRNSEIYSIQVADGTIDTLSNRFGPDNNPSISPDGKTIAYLGYDDKIQTYQVNHLYLMDINGQNKRMVKNPIDRSLRSLKWHPDGKHVLFLYDDNGISKIGQLSLDGNFTEVIKDVGGTVIGRPYGGGSYAVSKDGAIVFTHTRPAFPSDLIYLKGNSKMQLTDLNKDILPYRQLGEVEEVWYKSSFDKRDIQGWIVKPPFYDENRKYPLLVENHGGPISNYGERFSPEMQLYAAADYVVFYPNPRGSTGYGEEFGNLLYHNYPGEDYNDVMDGVDALLEKGLVHEDSLYVTGGSAGGIMTAWMIGKNNRFRAAAVVKPVMNWISKTLTADNYYGYAYYRYPGQPWENPDVYMKFSPVSLVGNIETPTMVMVGLSDLRTPLSEAKQLYHALKLRKKETMLVEIPGAFHNISARPSQLITKVDHILAWFERYR